VARLEVLAGARVRVVSSQDEGASLGIPTDDSDRAVQFVDGEGHRTQGAEAIFRALAAAGAGFWLWAYLAIPGVPTVSEGVYRFVAQHRRGVSRLVAWGHGPDLRPDPWTLTRGLYLRALGLVLLLAVGSYWVQIDALNGAGGILPGVDAVDRLGALGAERGWTAWEQFRSMPSLFALWPSDAALHGLSAMACLGAVLLMLGVFSGLGLVLVLLGYGSIVAVGGIFTGYQWDILLLETAFASLLVAPWSWRPGQGPRRRASWSGRWVLRVLLFKFMLLNGLVKLQSGDAPWEELTALQFHYWTQPIPHAVSWYAHHLPAWIHAASTVVMFVVELVLPFFIFGPRRLRMIAALGFVLLMGGILATGNYGTFNLMAIALSVSLLDDGAVRSLVPARFRDRLPDTRGTLHAPASMALRLPRAAVAAVLVLCSVWMIGKRADLDLPSPEAFDGLAQDARALRISASYGAFANMTETRPEILIEASQDGEAWSPYVLRYKTLEPGRAHGYAWSHMPRLDWQLWFAALRGSCKRTRWYVPFLTRLLEGAPEVHRLMDGVPFGGAPPTYIRSSLWHYAFTSPEERASTGDVWKRTRIRDFCPTVTLKDGELTVARLP
jgi:hypothetical protein